MHGLINDVTGIVWESLWDYNQDVYQYIKAWNLE